MPQLDKFTYLSQFFWLCLFFFTFYIAICNNGEGLLGISRILKLRNQLISNPGTSIEIIWWPIFPSIILMFIAIPSFALLYSMDEVVVDPAVTIKASGHQWYWTYEYDTDLDGFMPIVVEAVSLKDYGDWVSNQLCQPFYSSSATIESCRTIKSSIWVAAPMERNIVPRELNLFPTRPDNMGGGDSSPANISWEQSFEVEAEVLFDKVCYFFKKDKVIKKHIQPMLDARGLDFESSFRRFLHEDTFLNNQSGSDKCAALRNLVSDFHARTRNASVFERFKAWLQAN